MNVQAAKAAAVFAGIMPSPQNWQAHKGYPPIKVVVPGHNGKRYVVIVRHEWDTCGYVKTGECLLDTGNTAVAHACPNSGSDRLPCYHVLAAVMAEAKQVGKRVSFATSAAYAKRLANLGGKVFRVALHGSTAHVWGVAFDRVNGRV